VESTDLGYCKGNMMGREIYVAAQVGCFAHGPDHAMPEGVVETQHDRTHSVNLGSSPDASSPTSSLIDKTSITEAADTGVNSLLRVTSPSSRYTCDHAVCAQARHPMPHRQPAPTRHPSPRQLIQVTLPAARDEPKFTLCVRSCYACVHAVCA
jgi:hypothetical protein